MEIERKYIISKPLIRNLAEESMRSWYCAQCKSISFRKNHMIRQQSVRFAVVHMVFGNGREQEFFKDRHSYGEVTALAAEWIIRKCNGSWESYGVANCSVWLSRQAAEEGWGWMILGVWKLGKKLTSVDTICACGRGGWKPINRLATGRWRR